MKTIHLTHTALIISMAAFTPIVFAQGQATDRTDGTERTDRTERTERDNQSGRTTTQELNTVQPGSLTAVIADSATFSTLTKALKATGLDKSLGASDNYTIFAPTDEAFGKLPAETLTKLMLPENVEKLRMLLLNHVVAGKVLAADLQDGDVKTVNGEKISVDVTSEKIEVEGAKVYNSDVAATNGVMHSIGKVLVPKSLDGFAGLKD